MMIDENEVCEGPRAGWALAGIVTVVASFFIVTLLASQGEARGKGKIELTAIPSRAIQEAPPAGRPGDLERLHWSLRDRYGRKIGQAYFTCRWHRRHARLCIGEVTMPLGTMIAAGSSENRSVGTWAVTGGTGRYRNAGGELRFIATGVRRLTVTITI